MGKLRHVIIGCGPAAMSAVEAIRHVTQEDEIKIITREDTPPYSPAALPYLLSNELEEPGFFAKGEEQLESMNAHLLRGKEVVELVSETSQVQYQDGQFEGYDKLLIATGAHPRVPAIEGIENIPFLTFTTSRDFKKIEPILNNRLRISIYGAGQISVELAEKLAIAGHAVSVIVRSIVLRRYFGPTIINRLKETMEGRGVQILTQSTITAVEKHQDKIILTLNTRQELETDLLIIATGVIPNTSGFSAIPIIDEGLKTGKYMETSIPNVHAAGDVAAAPSFFDGRHGINPILPEAIEQGKIAGYNMAGEKVAYRGWISTNWLRCFDQYAFNMGLTGPGIEESSEVVEEGNGHVYRRLVFRDSCLIGIECLNIEPIHPGIFGYLITRRLPVGGYEDLLLNKPVETAAMLMARHRRTQSGTFSER